MTVVKFEGRVHKFEAHRRLGAASHPLNGGLKTF